MRKQTHAGANSISTRAACSATPSRPRPAPPRQACSVPTPPGPRPAPWEPSTHPFLQALPLLQGECVCFCDDRHNIHLVVDRLHERNIQWLQSKSHV